MTAWRNVFQRSAVEHEMDEEMRFHIEMETRELVARGVPQAEARRRALVSFGGVEQQKEHARNARAGIVVNEISTDLHFAWRWLRKSPAFTITAILTLALGIGATTVIFGVADHILLRPLPYQDSENLVTLWESDTREEGELEVAPGNFLTLAERSRSYSALGLAEPTGYDLIERGSAHSLNAWSVTDGFVDALGVRPVRGRLFTPADYAPGAPPVVVISYDLWRNRFGFDDDIVGRAVRLSEANVTVVGVLPQDLPYPEKRDLWAPKTFRDDERSDRDSRYQLAIGRLRPGLTIEMAQTEATAIARELAAEHAATNANTGFEAKSLSDHVLGNVRLALVVLAVAVVFLLLIACSNLANLMLARGIERAREMAIRTAIGAGRKRIARQLLTETMFLCAFGGIAGIAVALLGIRVLKAISPADLPRVATLHLDLRMLAISIGVTAATACVVGIAPVFRLARLDLLSDLRSGGRAIGSHTSSRLRSALVVAEVALALVLLTGTGLLGRSFARLLDNDLGFEPRDRYEVQTFIWDRTQGAEERIERTRAIEEQMKRIPGVEHVGATTALPFHPHQITMQRHMVIFGSAPARNEQRVFTASVTPGYFDALGMKMLEGRPFSDHDRRDGHAVAIISTSTAKRYFPSANPIGQRIALRNSSEDSLIFREIVGVTDDVRSTSLDADPQVIAYTPQSQIGSGSITFVAKVRNDFVFDQERLKQAVWNVDSGQPIYHAASLEDLIGETLAERRFQLVLLAVFSGMGMLLALIGIYGLITFIVRSRMREFGLRIAIGATRKDILMRVLTEAARLSAAGVAAGIVAAMLLSRPMREMLYDVEPTDPATFVQMAMLMIVAALIAALFPALRAAATQPLTVLRQD